MKHRKLQHEDEVPESKSISEGRACFKKSECWFRHSKPVKSHVPQKSPITSAGITTNDTHQDFWPGLPSVKPPDQMEKMLTMLTTVMLEVSQLKQQFQSKEPTNN